MRFSVITPVYNAAEYLPATLDSILGQTFGDFELFLVDDGSTDGASPELCRQAVQRDPQRVHAIFKENGGAGAARNAAFSQAKGEYLCFLDSDDLLEPDILEKLNTRIEATHADVYFYGSKEMDNGILRDEHPFPGPYGQVTSLRERKDLLLREPAAWCAAWRRSMVVDSGLYFLDGGWGEDLALTRKLVALAKTIEVLPDTPYLYQYHPGSVTHREQLDTNREIMTSLDSVLSWYKAQGLFDIYRDELCRLCVDNVLYNPSIRILKVVSNHPLLSELLAFTRKWFPDYRKCPYLAQDPVKHKIILTLLAHRLYFPAHLCLHK